MVIVRRDICTNHHPFDSRTAPGIGNGPPVHANMMLCPKDATLVQVIFGKILREHMPVEIV